MSSNLTHPMDGHTALPEDFHSHARANTTHSTGGSDIVFIILEQEGHAVFPGDMQITGC